MSNQQGFFTAKP